MVVVPDGFIQFKKRYAGYFWNTDTRAVYTLKGGVLRPLKTQTKTRPWPRWLQHGEQYVVISVNGMKRTVPFNMIDKFIDVSATVLHHRH